jgi:DNA polymerase-3 subunit alpha
LTPTSESASAWCGKRVNMHPPLTDVASSFSLGRSLWTVEGLVAALKSRKFQQACLTDWETLAAVEAFDRLMRQEGLVPWVGISFALDVSGIPREVRLVATSDIGWPALVNFREAARQPTAGVVAIVGATDDPWWEREPDWQDRPDVVVELKPYQREWLDRLPARWHWVPHCRVRYAEPPDREALRVLAAVVGSPVDATASQLPPSPVDWLQPFRAWPQEALWQPEGGDSVFSDRRWKFPHFGPGDEAVILKTLAERGLAERYRGNVPAKAQAQLARELEIITSLGFAGYFLIVQDLVHWARRQNIRVGPGRGSAAASLVSYALGITVANPLDYGLVFERFLNPARRNWPDIDLDFEDTRRGDVIQYLRDRHGVDRVAQVGTYGTLAARAALRDVARVLGLDPAKVQTVMGRIDWALHDHLDAHWAELVEAARAVGLSGSWLSLARRLEGLPRHRSTHAAGVIVTPEPLSRLLLCHGDQDSGWVTDFEMDALERLGFVKLDILGLRTLTLVAHIEEALGAHDYAIESVPGQDDLTLKLLARGDTDGVFQLDGRGVKTLLRQMKPRSREEVMVVLALYRPGPMDAIHDFLKRRRQGYQPSAEDPWEALCADTFGILVYQEQLIAAVQQLAGLSLAEADLVRRAISKKDQELLAAEGQRLIEAMTARGYREEQAERFWQLVRSFGDYGFNKAHAVSYGLLSYYLAYLKAHYPLPFWAAQLTVHDHSDKLKEVMRQAVSQGIEVLPPHVNMSGSTFVVEDQAIRAGLTLVRGIGADSVSAILAERARGGAYTSTRQLADRLKHRLNPRALAALDAAGALAGLGRLEETQMTLFDAPVEREIGPRSISWRALTGFGWPVAVGPIYVRVEGDEWIPRVAVAIGALAKGYPGALEVQLIKSSQKAQTLGGVTLAGHWQAIEAIKRLEGVVAAGRQVRFRE